MSRSIVRRNYFYITKKKLRTKRDSTCLHSNLKKWKLERPAVAMHFYKCIHLLQGTLIFLAKLMYILRRDMLLNNHAWETSILESFKTSRFQGEKIYLPSACFIKIHNGGKNRIGFSLAQHSLVSTPLQLLYTAAYIENKS